MEAPRRVQPKRAQCEVEGDDRDEQPVAVVVDDTGASTCRQYDKRELSDLSEHHTSEMQYMTAVLSDPWLEWKGLGTTQVPGAPISV